MVSLDKRIRRSHHTHHPFDQIIHVAKTPGLGPVPEHRDVLPRKRLNDEIAHHPAVIGMHVRLVGSKNGLGQIVADQLEIGYFQKMGNIAR